MVCICDFMAMVERYPAVLFNGFTIHSKGDFVDMCNMICLNCKGVYCLCILMDKKGQSWGNRQLPDNVPSYERSPPTTTL